FDKNCVILRDYTPGISQTVIPQSVLQESIIDAESEVIPLMRTALINETGSKGVRVNSEDEYSNIIAANVSKVTAAMTGQSYIPVVGQLDFQELDSGTTAQAAEYLQAYQAIDNIRCGYMGVGSGQSYQKTEHMLQAEADMNSTPIDAIIQDGLYQRQRFCNIFNSIFGTTVWCELKAQNAILTGIGESEDDAMSGGPDEGYNDVGGSNDDNE
ncbi:MAG: hypothetical protein HUJ63_03895, partial [Enterococcus sp.]|nr:hypothetical protein [Enterococcus sp.]